MERSKVSNGAAFCPGCGFQLWSQWGFCPRCGRNLEDLYLTLWQNPEGALVPPVTVRAPGATEALDLLKSGLVAEAEQRLRSSLREAPADIELRLILADVLVQRFEIQEANALLDEALAMAPDEFMVRLRRGEFLTRVGRNPEALSELDAAQGLPAPNVQALVFCRELRRCVADRARGSFVRQTTLPKRPEWLERVGARLRRARPRRGPEARTEE
jgi:tetratricopeptide (TPR) repeat protein